jgi:hypothetical protein
VLDALAKRLASRQPARRGPAKPLYIERCDFELGEILAYPHPKGAWTLLRVMAYFTRFRRSSPICEALDRNGAALPSAAAIQTIRYRRQKAPPILGNDEVPILGAARPAETVASLIEAGRLPRGATWADYEAQMIAPYIPIIRVSNSDPDFQRMKRLGIKAPSQRPFLNHWFVARNAWTTWKGLPARLEDYFNPPAEYRRP